MSILRASCASLPRAQGALSVPDFAGLDPSQSPDLLLIPEKFLTLESQPFTRVLTFTLNSLGSWLCKGPDHSQGSWLSPWIPFRRTVSDCNGQRLRSRRTRWWAIFFILQALLFPGPNLHKVWEAFCDGCPMMLQRSFPDQENNFLITRNIFLKTFSQGAITGPHPCKHSPEPLATLSFLVCYSPGKRFSLVASSHIWNDTTTIIDLTGLYIWWMVSEMLIIISFIWGSGTYLEG